MKSKDQKQIRNTILSAESILSRQGLKLTLARQILIQILTEATHPLKPAEICELSKKKQIDRVSVYRVLEAFEKIGLIHSVGDLGYVICSHLDHFDEGQDQHLYLVCDECDSVEEMSLSDKLQQLLKAQVLNQSKFKLKGSVQITGSCVKCSAA